MPYRFAHYVSVSFAEALLVCVFLYVLSERSRDACLRCFYCCGSSMSFPFLCLSIFFFLFCTISWWWYFTHKHGKEGNAVLSPGESKELFQHLFNVVFSYYLRGWFFLTLMLSMTLLLFGAALLFSLSLSFTWPTLALGCLSLLGGLGIFFSGGYRP